MMFLVQLHTDKQFIQTARNVEQKSYTEVTGYTTLSVPHSVSAEILLHEGVAQREK